MTLEQDVLIYIPCLVYGIAMSKYNLSKNVYPSVLDSLPENEKQEILDELLVDEMLDTELSELKERGDFIEKSLLPDGILTKTTSSGKIYILV